MPTQTDQRLVLDLLETGKIDTSEADWLLDAIDKPSARRVVTPYPPRRSNKIVLEIEADEENLQLVIEKLNQAICSHSAHHKKPPLLKRLARRKTPKATAH